MGFRDGAGRAHRHPRQLASRGSLRGGLPAPPASLQAAVVSAARVGLAMSRDSVMPKFFQRRSAGSASPWAATLTMSAVNLGLLALALGTSNIAAALTNAASSLGLISIVFYGITAAAALWQPRGTVVS